MALHKDRGQLGINATGQVEGSSLLGLACQQGWIMGNGDGMQIHHTEKGVVLVLQLHPVADRPQPIAQMKRTRWLDSRENPLAFHHTSSGWEESAVGSSTVTGLSSAAGVGG